MLLFGVSAITLGAIAQPLRERFGLDSVGIGKLFSVFPMGVLLGALVFGPVCDRYGYRHILIVAALSIGLGLEGLAWLHAMPLLYGAIFLLGFGGGVLNGATSGVVNAISQEHKGANLSILGIFYSVGAIGMPLMQSWLGRALGPFQLIGGLGHFGLAIALWYGFVPFPGPRAEVVPGAPKWSFLFQPLILSIALFLLFQATVEGCINNWSTTYLTGRGTLGEAQALFGLSVHMAGMTLARLLAGSVWRDFSKEKLLWIGLLLLLPGIWGIQATEVLIVWIGLFLAGAGVALGFPLLLGYIGERFPQGTATAFSFVFSAALVGNMLLNYGMGYVIREFGLGGYPLVFMIGTAGMALALFQVSRALRH